MSSLCSQITNDSDYVDLSAVPRSTINPPYEIRNKDRKTSPSGKAIRPRAKENFHSAVLSVLYVLFIFAFVNDKHRNGSGGCFFPPFFLFFWFENRSSLVCKRNRRTSEIPGLTVLTGQLMFRVLWIVVGMLISSFYRSFVILVILVEEDFRTVEGGCWMEKFAIKLRDKVT